MVLRKAWKVSWWCTRQGARLVLWTGWFLLVVLLAFQAHLLSTRQVSVPEPLRQAITERLAARGLRFEFGRAVMDFSGNVIVEHVSLGPASLPGPLATAASVYAKLDPWDLLFRRLDILELRVSGLDLRLPSADASSGVSGELAAGGIDLAVRPAGRDLEVSHFTGYVGRVPVVVAGRLRLPGASGAGTLQGISPEKLTAVWTDVARRARGIDAWLAAADSPRLVVGLQPAPRGEPVASVEFLAASVDLSKLPGARSGILTGVRAAATVRPTDPLPLPLEITGAVSSARLAPDWEAGPLAFRLRGKAGGEAAPVLGSLEVQLDSLRWREIEAGPIAIDLAPEGETAFRVDLSLGLARSPWRLRGTVDPLAGQAGVTLDGFVGDATLAFVGAQIGRDLATLLDPAQAAPLHAAARFAPGWKLMDVSGRVHSGFVLVGGVPLHETGTEFFYDGERVLCDNLVLRQGASLAHGSYEMDTRTMDFRFLLTGGLRPMGISGWFHEWWSNFFQTFAFSRAAPVADVDVGGRWGDPAATRVFVAADGVGAGVKGVEFDRVRARLFLRPQWFDIRHFEVGRGDQAASGWLSRSVDLERDTWRRMDFSVESSLPLATIERLFPEESTELLAPYRFDAPPRLRLAGRVESAASPEGKHERIDIGLTSAGGMTFHDFALSDLVFQARLVDDRIELPVLAFGFAGGRAQGQATLQGPGDARRLGFNITLAGANLGAVTQVAGRFQPAAPVATAAPLAAKVAEAARLRQERLDRGRVDFNLSAEGLYGDFHSFKGGGRGVVTGTELGQLNLFGPLSEVLRGSIINLGSFSLTAVDAPFELEGDRVRFDELKVTGPSALLQAKGYYHLNGGSLDFSAKVYPFDEATSILGSAVGLVLNPLSRVFEVRLQGTLANPSWIFAYGPSRLLNTLVGSEKSQRPSPSEDSAR
jgi:hypothetical protein